MDKNIYKNYLAILREEMIPAMGCTEPIALAYGAARAREILGKEPERIVAKCSGNIIKNVKAVTVPNTGGLKGIEAAAAAGIVAGRPELELEVLSSLNPIPGTVVKEVTKDMEGMLIKGVAKDTDVAVITILNVPDEPGMSFRIFGLLAQKNINVDIILQSTGRDGKKDISFTCAEGEAELAMRVLKESAHFNDVSVDTTCAKVSIVGAGMQSHSGVASKMFEAMSNNNINIKMISTSEIKISCIIDRADADKAVGAIHDMLFD